LTRENRILSRDWSRYDTSHVVIQPKRLTPDQLQAGYLRVFREAYAKDCMARRLQGTTACRPFFVPMNFGFRDSMEAFHRRAAKVPDNGDVSAPASEEERGSRTQSSTVVEGGWGSPRFESMG
jgi:hypothetical protein